MSPIGSTKRGIVVPSRFTVTTAASSSLDNNHNDKKRMRNGSRFHFSA